jgi:hypothetical protein
MDIPKVLLTQSLKSRDGSHLKKKKDKPLGFVYIPHVKGVSEKFRCIGN